MEQLELIKKYGIFILDISVVFPIEGWMYFITEDWISIHNYTYSCEQPRAMWYIFMKCMGTVNQVGT